MHECVSMGGACVEGRQELVGSEASQASWSQRIQ